MKKFLPFSAEIEQLVNSGIDAIEKDQELKSILNILFMKTEKTKTPPCCEGARQTYFNEVEAYYQSVNPNFKRPYIMSNSNEFVMKKGMRHYIPSISAHITSDNCTDALAVESLAENKGRINGFEKFPTDWEERVKKFLSKDEAPETKASKAAETKSEKGK